ncbi:MAG: (2Fe-2S)-binding protein [Lachnospiraceae bacterium]|nr:(2Fe-2S)-binding protein [Lachnospiraceae bacterium]
MVMRLWVNGVEKEVQAEEDTMLIDLLRDRLHLTGTKKSCCSGECGACTVLVDGLPFRSCITPALVCEGRRVETIEGLGDAAHVHPIQQAFVDAGAVQCGFCTPGMILTAKALLEKNPEPTEEEIVEAMSGNFCRCTGYVKILDAVRSLVPYRPQEKEEKG